MSRTCGIQFSQTFLYSEIANCLNPSTIRITLTNHHLKTYYPTINLLRGVAALSVCLYHFIGYEDFRGDLFASNSLTSDLANFGVNGIFLFFVISGFVIPFSLAKADFKLTRLHRFLSRRFIRIEIPYLVSILFILAIGVLFAFKNNTNVSFSFERFIYHIFYVIPFSSFEWYNVIYWTLAIEFQFYIVIGLLFYFLSSQRKITVLFALLIFGFSSFLVPDNRFVFHYATIFSQGIILFLVKTNRVSSKTGLVFIGAFVLATAYIHSIEVSVFSVLTLCAIHFLEIDTKMTNRFGDISYSFYLTHGFIGGNVLYFFSRYVTSYSGKMALVLSAVTASFVFAFIFWRFIENPARKLSRKITDA